MQQNAWSKPPDQQELSPSAPLLASQHRAKVKAPLQHCGLPVGAWSRAHWVTKLCSFVRPNATSTTLNPPSTAQDAYHGTNAVAHVLVHVEGSTWAPGDVDPQLAERMLPRPAVVQAPATPADALHGTLRALQVEVGQTHASLPPEVKTVLCRLQHFAVPRSPQGPRSSCAPSWHSPRHWPFSHSGAARVRPPPAPPRRASEAASAAASAQTRAISCTIVSTLNRYKLQPAEELPG